MAAFTKSSTKGSVYSDIQPVYSYVKHKEPFTYMVKDFAFSWLPSIFALFNDVHVSLYKSNVL